MRGFSYFCLAIPACESKTARHYMQSEHTHSGDLYSLLGWLEKNRNQLIGGAVVIALVVIGINFVSWRKSEARIAAGNAVSAAVLSGEKSATSPESLLKIAGDHEGTPAAARAVLMAAGKQFTDGKIEEAKTTFQRFINDYPESRLMAQAKYGVAVCLEAQGKTAEATTAFKEVVDRYAGENTTIAAKFSLARLYEAEGKLEQARDYYLDIAREGRSSYAMDAMTRLSALIQKNPNLRPAAPAVSAQPMIAPGQ